MRIFLVAGERSGDVLGAKLIEALRAQGGSAIEVVGVGGEAMARAGMASLFPLDDIAVNGFVAVLRRAPALLRRIAETADACVAFAPDALVLIDAPDFTHRVARRVRLAAPGVRILDYVSPSVWAWRPGRASAMRAYVDGVLCLFPFEPAAHATLGGPPCTFVGHPLIEELHTLRPSAAEEAAHGAEPAPLLVMPGSRASEIERLMPVFGETVRRLASTGRGFTLALPAVAHLEGAIRAHARDWPVQPDIVVGEREKRRAMRGARAALVASGTATLEVALAGAPLVVAYRVSAVEGLAKYAIRVSSIVLPNLILGENVVPEFIQRACTPAALAHALERLLDDPTARARQCAAFARLPALLAPADGAAPSRAAARAIRQSLDATV